MNLVIIGAANSKTMIFDEQGLDPTTFMEELPKSEVFNQANFLEQMRSLNLRNSIFIDITASAQWLKYMRGTKRKYFSSDSQ